MKGRLSNLRDQIQKQGFDIYSDEERGDFTFIEAVDSSYITIYQKIVISNYVE
jgi:hypothetical protein